jgi:hypothetical protein
MNFFSSEQENLKTNNEILAIKLLLQFFLCQENMQYKLKHKYHVFSE